MPSGIFRVNSGRETDWKGAHAHAGLPFVLTDQLIKGLMKNWVISRSGKRFLTIHTEPDYWLSPSAAVIRITGQILP